MQSYCVPLEIMYKDFLKRILKREFSTLIKLYLVDMYLMLKNQEYSKYFQIIEEKKLHKTCTMQFHNARTLQSR